MTDPIVCPGCGKRRPGSDVYEHAKASGDWTEWADADRAYGPCCNQLCGGTWGTGCHHCHHPRFWPTCVYRRWAEARGMSHVLSPLALLSALALEIDERMATPTGERVCRACGGRGRTVFAIYPEGTVSGRRRGIVGVSERTWEQNALIDLWVDSWTAPGPGDPPPPFIPDAIAEYNAELDRAIVTIPCPCDGPTRPDTDQLHYVVERLAEWSRPLFTWPDHWLTIADEAEARGGWIGRWWVAFREWTWAGEMPDAEALARDLAALIPALEKRERAKRARRTDLHIRQEHP